MEEAKSITNTTVKWFRIVFKGK